MRQNAFNAIVERQLYHCQKILCQKADEYVTEGDRLSNFKTAAILQNMTPIQALGGMMAKHIVALYDFMEKDEKAYARWDEKITDTINYCLLLKALLAEYDIQEDTKYSDINTLMESEKGFRV